MARLRQRDIAAFSQGLERLYTDSDPDSLSARILACLRTIFDCDFASFSLMDTARGCLETSAMAPTVIDWPGMTVHQKYLRHDPAAVHIMRTRDPRAVRISDFVSLREYRSLSIYAEVFGLVGCDRRLGFASMNGSPVSLAATLNRKGRDFSEEERGLLDVLRPHLLQANSLASTHRRLVVERERERKNAAGAFGVGLGEIDTSGRLCWLSPRADALLKAFFPLRGPASAVARLPDELHRRLTSVLPMPGSRRATGTFHAQPPLQVWYFAGPGGRRLKVQLAVGNTPERWQILLEEPEAALPAQALASALKLTPREGEVLCWLIQGKTNWEIGTILRITGKTAGKHLENIFSKLNVGTRAAAVRVALEAGGCF